MTLDSLISSATRLIWLAAKFGAVGLSTVAVYFGILYVLHPLIQQTAILAAVCYLLSAVYNYLMQSMFTFQAGTGGLGSLLRYLAMQGSCMALNSFLMFLLVDSYGIALFVAQACVTVLIAVLSFTLSYLWVYR